MISMNGSAARRTSVGDLLIIASFAQVYEDQVLTHDPQLIFVDEQYASGLAPSCAYAGCAGSWYGRVLI